MYPLICFFFSLFPKMAVTIFRYSSEFSVFFRTKIVSKFSPNSFSSLDCAPFGQYKGSRPLGGCNTRSPRSTRFPSILSNLFGRESFSTLDLQSCAKEDSSGARMAWSTNHTPCASSENRIRLEPEIPGENQTISGGVRANILA